MLPFGLLLAGMALGPLLFRPWWEKHYGKTVAALGAITVGYYLLVLPAAAAHTVAQAGRDYLGFIALVGSLFVVSGGLHITVKGEGTPAANVLFLLAGALLANVLGTVGASLLLIRPWLRVNGRRAASHHVVFFIFIVSNAGGCLAPFGNPPLFLGCLMGVPFWWVAEHCWPMWLCGIGALLAVFYFVDRRALPARPRVGAVVAGPAVAGGGAVEPGFFGGDFGGGFCFAAALLTRRPDAGGGGRVVLHHRQSGASGQSV